MKLIKYPAKKDWKELTKRPASDLSQLQAVVDEIFQEVQNNGDQALIALTKKFDKCALEQVVVPVEKLSSRINKDLQNAIDIAYRNIKTFHRTQIQEKEPKETTAGVVCWREARAIEKVGLYIPGGSAPLFSTVLMLGIPAQIAGCKEIVLCTPPNEKGEINPAIVYAAKLCGIENIARVGGIQAIAAMTFGTESIPRVSKIFGPGNAYVTAAKQRAQVMGVAIDMPAGPSEVLVIAGKKSEPSFVAADLLSQAEHGPDSQVVLLTTKEKTAKEVQEEVAKQLAVLPRIDVAQKAIDSSMIILLDSLKDCFEFSNLYAPEHLILAMEEASSKTEMIENAGSVFLGNYSCESAGDYASGTNHTLPTNGYANAYSGVSLDSFVKKITFQEISKKGIKNLGPIIEIMAEAEGLDAHKNAVSVRLKKLKND